MSNGEGRGNATTML